MREISAILSGATERRKNEHNDRAWAAWTTAYLTAYPPAKPRNFQKLKTLMYDTSGKTKRRQTIDEQIAIAHQWTAVAAQSKL